ncbi:MAG: hypothetical protein AAF399_05740, partial [Bacteroidota bacterium]
MSKFSIALLVSALTSFFVTDPDDSRTKAEVRLPAETADVYLDHPPLLLPFDGDTNKVKKNPNDRRGDATQQEYVTPLYLGNPSNMRTSYELEDDLSGFSIYEKVGDVNFRKPSFISYEDYIRYRREKEAADYFREQSLMANRGEEQGLQLNI